MTDRAKHGCNRHEGGVRNCRVRSRLQGQELLPQGPSRIGGKLNLSRVSSFFFPLAFLYHLCIHRWFLSQHTKAAASTLSYF